MHPAASASPTAPQVVEIRVTVSPASAKLFMDGTEMTNRPFVVSQLADAKDHTFRGEAAGHDPEERVLKFDQSREIALVLKKSSGGGFRAPVVTPPPPKPEEPEITNKKKPPSTQLDPGDPWK
jgi:hypothetical protein